MLTAGKTNAEDGGNPNEPAWVRQNGQCSICIALSVGIDDLTGLSASATLTNLEPVTEQISVQEKSEPFAAATAWEIEGASDASKIAKNAIHAENCRAALFRAYPVVSQCY